LLDTDRGLGAFATFTSRQAEAGPVTVRLAPCGSATARFVNAQGKPLTDYRPLLWLSLPGEPYSAPKDLERLARHGFLYGAYDAVWVGVADPRRHGAGPRTDAQGRLTFPSLIPGATYRVALFGGTARDFRGAAGGTVNLGDLTVTEPEGTRKLPTIK